MWTSASSPVLGRSRALVRAAAPPRAPACPAPCGLCAVRDLLRSSLPPRPYSRRTRRVSALRVTVTGRPRRGRWGCGRGHSAWWVGTLSSAETPPSGIRRPRGFAALGAPNAARAGGRSGPFPLPRLPVPRGSVAVLLPSRPAAGRKGLSRHILTPSGLRYSTDPLPPSSCRPALPGPCDRPTGDEQAKRRGRLPGAPMRRPFGPRGLVADRGGDRRCAPSVGDRNKRG